MPSLSHWFKWWPHQPADRFLACKIYDSLNLQLSPPPPSPSLPIPDSSLKSSASGQFLISREKWGIYKLGRTFSLLPYSFELQHEPPQDVLQIYSGSCWEKWSKIIQTKVAWRDLHVRITQAPSPVFGHILHEIWELPHYSEVRPIILPGCSRVAKKVTSSGSPMRPTHSWDPKPSKFLIWKH